MTWELALMILLGLALAGTTGGEKEGFRAKAVTHRATITLAGPIGDVFSLFTPLGEKHWAPGWDPEILYPADREIAENMLFRTRDEGETYWVVTRLEEGRHAVAYQNFAPDYLANTVKVSCRPVASEQTEVTVEYRYVGLSERGNRFVQNMDAPAYAAKMAHWTEVINHYLRTGKKLHP